MKTAYLTLILDGKGRSITVEVIKDEDLAFALDLAIKETLYIFKHEDETKKKRAGARAWNELDSLQNATHAHTDMHLSHTKPRKKEKD